MPAIQSIGLASDGALDQKTIDKLKEADEQAQIVPIEKRITETKKQNTELSSLLVSIAGMKGAQNPLYDELEYLKVKTNTIGKSVNPIVSTGVSPQNINISVKQLAQEDIIQSKAFQTKEDVLSKKDTTIGISINSRTYEVKIKGSEDLKDEEKATTLDDLPALILEATSGKIISSIINTGGSTPFTLVLKSKTVGKDNAILIGTPLKASKAINQTVLREVVFKKSDVNINGVEIFDKLAKTKHTGEVIDDENNLPAQFNPGDLKINGIDIFDGTIKTNTTTSTPLIINTTAKDGDFLLNGTNIFDTSGFSEAESTIKLDSLSFPLNIGLNTLNLNGVDIFDSAQFTRITTAILKDDSVSGTYKHNNLMINGVSIFDEGDDTDIDSISKLVDYINLKTNDTNVSATTIQLSNGNVKMQLINEVSGDNIDINTNDSLQLAKMRLFKGVTLGKSTIPIKDKQVLLEMINEKKQATKVEAFEVDGNLVLRSRQKNGRIIIKAINPSFIDQIGLKEDTYNKSIPVKLESISDVISQINKKTNLHNIVATNKDGKLYLEHTELGKNIDISGEQEFLEKINLLVTTIKPERGKLISSIDELITSINAAGATAFIQASQKDKKVFLSSTRVSTDIIISGKTDALALIGLAEVLIPAINGEKLENSNEFVERINDKSSKTNVQAFLGNDGRVTLLNTLGGNIKFSGDESQLNILSLSIDDSTNIQDVESNSQVLEKLGISESENKLQSAQDSIFSYNGVEITRSSNNVDGIVSGIDFQFQEIDTGNASTNISITKDKETVITSFFEFITAYNSFIRKVADLTKFTFDEDSPADSETGVFQGKTTVTNIPFQLSTILGTILPDTKINSLISLGIDFTREGTLSYKEDEIRNKINASFEDVEKLFRGYTKTSLAGKDEEIDGIFKQLNAKINDLTKGKSSVLETFKSSIEQETSRLKKTLKRTQETIDSRNEQLKQSFIANDAAIGKINNNFNALKTQIDYETANKN